MRAALFGVEADQGTTHSTSHDETPQPVRVVSGRSTSTGGGGSRTANREGGRGKRPRDSVASPSAREVASHCRWPTVLAPQWRRRFTTGQGHASADQPKELPDEDDRRMKRHAKELISELEALGFEFDRVNAKSFHVYTHPRHADVSINAGIQEHQAKHLIKKVKRDLDCLDEVAKRNPAQIKERQAFDREKAAQERGRLDRERADLVRRKDALLAGKGSRLSNAEIRAIEQLIEANDRERRRLEALMTSQPASASHRGTGVSRHRSGAA